MPLLTRLTSTWRSRVTSPHTCARNAVVHLVGQVELLLRRLGGQQVERVLDAGAQVEGSALQFELAGFDLREVEDVVDDGEQGFAAGVDRFHVAALLVGQRGFQQQARSWR